MANDDNDANLAVVASVFALVAISLWLIPQEFPKGADSYEQWNENLTMIGNGLTDFTGQIQGDYRGRMPAFIVSAFTSIFCLLLRRR